MISPWILVTQRPGYMAQRTPGANSNFVFPSNYIVTDWKQSQELSPVSSWVPETQAEREAFREQLERLLANPLFKHSRRYPSMLRYVVEHALSGHTAQVKERTLGIEVFARDPHYDTNLDPVVRTTA